MKRRESLFAALGISGDAKSRINAKVCMERRHDVGAGRLASRGMVRRPIMRWTLSLFLAAFLLTATAPPAWGALQEYRDWNSGTMGMILQSLAYDEANIYVLGESSTPGIYQTATLISNNPEVEDGGAKNVVLFECGMHGREWYAAESCYWLTDYLLTNRRTSLVRDLLANTDIWIIPQSNPAGRAIDDLGGGDPTQFVYVCEKGGPGKMGTPCSRNRDCGTAGVCNKNGWRANGNRVACPLGVDPARNFSSGWDWAAAACDSEKRCGEGGILCTSDNNCTSTGNKCDNTAMKYRGPHPFSEPETLNLRRFVHNHMLSMAAISHTNSQTMWNNWNDSNTPTQFMTDQLEAISVAGSAAYAPSPELAAEHCGGGYGQFSAWLTQPSDVLDEPDVATRRNISTFYFELPMIKTVYDANFRDSLTDTSNSFHPSSDEVKVLWDDAIRDLFIYVARQARSPQCPVDDSGNRLDAECRTNDFGLVGAKIANATNEPGLLSYNADTRQETLPSGTRQIVFAVQNMSSSGTSHPPTSTHANVSIQKDSTVIDYHSFDVSLNPGERATYSVGHNFQIGHNYTVIIWVDTASDNFTGNNMKVFRFRVPSPFTPYYRVSLGTSVLQFSNQGKTLGYTGTFSVDSPLDPRKTGLQITLYGHRSYLPDVKPFPASVTYVLPKGQTWWAQSKPALGLWVYSDPKGVKGPVRSLVIKKPPKPSSNGKNPTSITMTAIGGDLSNFVGAQSYRVDFDMPGTKLRLSSLARGVRPVLPPKKVMPGDETEIEPNGPSNNAQ